VTVHHSQAAPPPGVTPGYTGPVVLPGTGRLVYWTGRVAIGLRHAAPARYAQPIPHSQLWVQELLLAPASGAAS